jgi:spore cortex biosynthesis protein YabQ
MGLSNAQQLTVLLYSLLFGVGLGAAYDVLRVFRVFVSCHPVAVLFQDLFYFVLAAVASFIFVFEVNDGTVRLFILAAFFAGGMAERISLGQIALRVSRRIQAAISRRKMLRNGTHTTHKRRKRHRKQGKIIA